MPYAFLFLSILFFSASTRSQSGPELVFSNPVLKSGIANKQGAVYRFSNITSGVDAEVKLKKFSRPDIVMTNIDVNNTGWDKAFQPQFGLPGLVLPFQNWYIDFEMTFYFAGTNTTRRLDTVDLTALDVDGDGWSISEYATFENPSSIAYSTVSFLTSTISSLLGQSFTCPICNIASILISCHDCGGDGITNSGSGNNNECQDCDGTGLIYDLCDHGYQGIVGNTILGPINNFLNIDTSATQVMATYQYRNKDRIRFRYGAKSAGLSSNGSGIRLNSTWFREFSLTPIVTLPVKWTEFTATLDKNKVQLKWITASEKNVSHFEVERSTDGSNYEQIGIVFANGNTDIMQTYLFPDDVTNLVGKTIYYRVRSVDIDERAEYSQVRIIQTHNKNGALLINTYPNPVVDELRITIPNAWQGKQLQLQLFNQQGQQIKSSSVSRASQTETLRLAGLSRGFYVVKALCEDVILQQKILKH